MKKILALIFIFILSSAAFGDVNKKTVLRAWQSVTKAENFSQLPLNFENDDEPNAWVAYDDDGYYTIHVTTGLMKILKSENEKLFLRC